MSIKSVLKLILYYLKILIENINFIKMYQVKFLSVPGVRTAFIQFILLKKQRLVIKTMVKNLILINTPFLKPTVSYW